MDKIAKVIQHEILLNAECTSRLPIKLFTTQRYLAFYRVNQWWYAATSDELTDKQIQFILIENSDHSYTFLLPINQGKQRLSFSAKAEQIYLSDQSNISFSSAQYLQSDSSDPYECCKLAFTRLRNNKPPLKAAAFWNKLGWCTWDAFYKNVSLDKIKQGLRSLADLDHAPGWLVIDDGWQQFEGQLLNTIEPTSDSFLPKLQDNIEQIKSEFDIRVGVWHAFLGYWAGYNPKSAWPSHWQFINNKIRFWPNDKQLTNTHIVDKNNIEESYQQYHTYLSKELVDFVKIDGQAFLEKALPKEQDLESFSISYQNALHKSVQSNFQQQSIHCMAHEPYIVQHASCAIWRNSEDYFPDEVDQGIHIQNNIFNSLWSQFIAIPDWDMFQTPHKHSEYHAIARVISGGPIYISDIPGEHDHALLARLTINGNHLLKPDAIATPARQSLFSAFEDRRELLIVNNIANKCGLLGIFNCQNYGVALNKLVSSKDLSVPTEQLFTIYSSRTNKAQFINRNDDFYVELPAQQAELLTFIPIHNNFSLIGIIDKILSIKTIENITVNNQKIEITVNCSGTFMFNYYGNKKLIIQLNNKPKTVTQCDQHSYHIAIPKKGMLSFATT